MPSLTADDQSAVRFHLGYSSNVPSGDLAHLNNAMNNVADVWTVAKISGLIARCDNAYNLTEIDAGALVDNSSEVFDKTEDLVVTESNTVFANRATYALRYRNYENETYTLALSLGVPNYRMYDFW